MKMMNGNAVAKKNTYRRLGSTQYPNTQYPSTQYPNTRIVRGRVTTVLTNIIVMTDIDTSHGYYVDDREEY